MSAPSDQATWYPGSFSDGRTAARHDVTVSLEAFGLAILDADQRLIATWPYRELALVDDGSPSGPVRLRRAEDPARLTILDGAALAALTAHAPKLAGPRHRGLRALGLVAAGLAGAVALGVLAWQGVPLAARWTAAVVPVSWEETLGERLFDEVVAILTDDDAGESRTCEAAAGRAALDRLTARLADAAQAPYRFNVFVVDADLPNAFALPGGWVVLFRGLIEQAESPEEVAGVLAHEIGHVVHRHGTERIFKALGVQLLVQIVMGGVSDGLMSSAGQILLLLSYSREDEAEADAAALDLLAAAGMRNDGLAAFFRRLAEQDSDLPEALRFLSTHPSHGARARDLARPQGSAGAAMSDDDWQALRQICAG